MVKKIVLIMVLLAPMLIKAQQKSYAVIVALKALKMPAKAYIVSSYGWTDQKVLDSASSTTGTFKFLHTLEEPLKVSLMIDHQPGNFKGWKKNDDFLTFYMEQKDIHISGTDSVKFAALKGGSVNSDFQNYNATVMSSLLKFTKASEAMYLKATPQERAAPVFIDSMMDQLKLENKKADSLKLIFIRNYPKSYISLAALKELAANKMDMAKVKAYFESLSPEIRITSSGLALSKLLYDNGPTSVGKKAPDFIQSDVSGNLVKLSDFGGKYVLLDFWASWCGPCRAENPVVAAAYHKYKDKNFTVLGVSLDRPDGRAAWLHAIAKDALVWTQVSDLKYWNNAAAKIYEVSAIPQNFLIDPQGRIVAKNLRGEVLEKKLAELLSF